MRGTKKLRQKKYVKQEALFLSHPSMITVPSCLSFFAMNVWFLSIPHLTAIRSGMHKHGSVQKKMCVPRENTSLPLLPATKFKGNIHHNQKHQEDGDHEKRRERSLFCFLQNYFPFVDKEEDVMQDRRSKGRSLLMGIMYACCTVIVHALQGSKIEGRGKEMTHEQRISAYHLSLLSLFSCKSCAAVSDSVFSAHLLPLPVCPDDQLTSSHLVSPFLLPPIRPSCYSSTSSSTRNRQASLIEQAGGTSISATKQR